MERGTNEEEIREVISLGFPIRAKQERVGKAKVFDFQRTWRNKYYEHKRVEVIYVLEKDTAITVTTYVFYGKWEKHDADPL